jgi:endo-1,4-beta-xylanase
MLLGLQVDGESQPQILGPAMCQLASKANVQFGTTLTKGQIRKQTPIRDLIIRNCSILTPNTQMKWDALRPTPSTFEFGDADLFVTFCEEHKMSIHGHTLVWYQALPPWFDRYATPSNALRLLTDHINVIVKRYRGKIRFWDVVNEIVRPFPNRPNCLRDSTWLKLLGPAYIEEAFHAAHESDPSAVLVWNEDDLESDTEFSKVKRKCVLQVLVDLRRKGIPVHGFGLQAHLKPTFNKNNRDYIDFLKALKDTGVQLLISELDVIDTDIEARNRDQQVAQLYFDFLTTTAKTLKPVSIQVWELSDANNWLDSSMPSWKRPDGSSHRPAVLDNNYKAKPAWWSLQKALEELS